MRGAWACIGLVVMACAHAAPATGDFTSCAGVEEPAARLACYDRASGRAPEPPVVRPAPDPVPPPVYGRTPKPEPQPTAFDARISGTFDGWKRGQVVRLDNGQAWEVIETREGHYPGIPDDPKVQLAPGLLGSWWMIVEGVGRRMRVRRVK